MMKFILIPLLMLIFQASSFASWFFPDSHREQQLEQQIQQEQHCNTALTVIVVVLGVGCVVTFVAGTMVGSKTRRKPDEN